MSADIETKKLMRNAWRITSKRPWTCLRVRIPGGHLEARFLPVLQEIADQFGNGTLHLTTRQGIEIPGIAFEYVPEVNRRIRPLIESMQVGNGVIVSDLDAGYPAAGMRNIAACIGNRVCPFANYDTTALAKRIEGLTFPKHVHVKIALTGCPNDCIKAHLQDFGIIGQAAVELDGERCVGCEACIRNCRERVTGAIEFRREKAFWHKDLCIGCGECVLRCPTNAWSRNPVKFFRIIVLGRTGKRNPRLAASFLEFATEEVVLSVLKNVFPYIEKYIDRKKDKEHLGYIVDRTGYPVFREALLTGVALNSEARVAESLEFSGYRYQRKTSWEKHEPIF